MKKPFLTTSLRLYPLLLAGTLFALSGTSSACAEDEGGDQPNNPDRYKCVKNSPGDNPCDNNCDEEACDAEDDTSAAEEVSVGENGECPDGYTKVKVENGGGGGARLSPDALGMPESKYLLARAWANGGTISPKGLFYPGFVSPSSVKVYGDSSEVIRDANTHVRQVKASKGLLDILYSEPRTLLINYYKLEDIGQKSNGIYTIKTGATPLKTIKLSENEAGDTVERQYTDNRATHPSTKNTRMTRQATDDVNTFILTKTFYKGEDLGAVDYKKVTTHITAIPDGEPFEEQYIATTEELGTDGQWHLTSRIKGRRAQYKESRGLLPLYECNAVDASGAPLPGISTETTYTYYADPLDNASYGKLRTLRRNNGYWENKYYTANMSAGVETEKTETPWLNTPAHEPGDTTNGPIRTRTEVYCSTDTGTEGNIEVVDGKTLSYEWTDKRPVDQDKVKLVRYQPHSGGTKTTTTIRYRAASDIPDHLKARPLSVQHADGKLETWTYTLDGSTLTTTHDSGQGDSDTVTQGIRTLTTHDYPNGNLQTETRYALQDGQAHWLSSQTGVEFDHSGLCLKWIYNNTPEDHTEIRRDCCHITWRRDRNGSETTYTYDAAGRRTGETTGGITRTYQYNGLTTTTYRQLAGSNEKYLVERTTRDLAGNITERATPAFGGGELLTTIQHNIPARTTNTTAPTGTTSSASHYADKQDQTITGETGITTTYAYTPSTSGGLTITATEGTNQTTQTQDLLGHTTTLTTPSGAATHYQYTPAGNLARTTDPDGEITLTTTQGQTTLTCLDKNRNGTIDLDTDTATRQTTTYDPSWPENTGSWKTTQEIAYLGQWLLRETTWTTEDNTQTRQQTRGVAGYKTHTSPAPYQTQTSYTATTTYPTGQQIFIQNEKQNGILSSATTTLKDSTGTDVTYRQATYNTWGQLISEKDPRTGTTTYTYDTASDLPLTKTTPAGHITTNQYDPHGQLTTITLPDGTTQHFAYDPHHRLTRQWGSQQYPVQYEYDPYGRKIAMNTYRTPVSDAADWPGEADGDKTTWTYTPSTGLLAQKKYADGHGPAYTYTPAGKLKTTTNARGHTITHTYDPIGQLISTTVNDNGLTPTQTYTWNQLGNLTQAHTQGIAQYQYTYSPDTLSPIREDITIPSAENTLTRQIHRTYDTWNRPTGYTLNNGPTVEQTLHYTYNPAGQITAITADGKQTTYTYQPGAPHLLAQVQTPVHTVTNTWDTHRDTLLTKANTWKNKPDNTPISTYTYTVNPLGQRTTVTTAGEAFGTTPANWQWTYDPLGQLTTANNHTYTYDQIGNRIQARESDTAPATTYTANTLNQYTAVSEISPQYDLDGNLTSGLTPTAGLPNRHQLHFTHNAHNRPIKITQSGTTVETCTYDHQGRRIQKGTTTTLYDGYNAIAQYNTATTLPTLQETYAWGLDLTNTLQDAGGVGGLLTTTDHTTQTPLTSYPAYDGNGNITQYLTETNNGTLTATYQYSPFGKVEKKTGTKEYTYQFSTKPFDTTTALNYYNYRTYDPIDGRWINRDPIEEEGGSNLYTNVSNNIINSYDILGLSSGKRCCCGKSKLNEKSCCDSEKIKSSKSCKIVIFMGHSGEDMKERLQKCKADRVGVTSCHQKEMAGHIEKNRQFENKNRGKQEDSKGLLKMGEKATAALQSEFDAAVEEANTMCTSAKDCCTSVTITIQSKDGGEAVRRFNQNNNASGSRGSHSKKIQCTSKTCQQRGGTEKC